jgi:hypothetical protein
MKLFLSLCLVIGVSLTAVEKEPILVKKARSPINDDARIMFIQDQLINKNEDIVVRTRSAAIGQLTESNSSLSSVQRKDRFVDILAVIDGKISFVFTYADGMPFIETQRYFHYTCQKRVSSIPGGLTKGPHAIVAILRNSYGETLKVSSCVDAMVFSYQSDATKKELQDVAAKLEKPQLIYNEPSGNFRKGQPILLDFYELNCTLGSTGYKVAVYLDDKLIQKVTSWNPYIIKNVVPGQHKVRLELISPNEDIVDNPFDVKVEGTFNLAG